MRGPLGPDNEQMNSPNASSGRLMPELRYLAIGRIVRAHGITGEVSVTVLTDFPERFETIEWVYIGNEFEAEAYRLASYRWHKKNVLLSLDGVTNRTEAEQLRGQFVQILLEEAMPLSNGDHYLYQLIGLQVITTQGEELGIVDHILETGANDVYVIIAPDQAEVLLPAIDDVVKSVDLETGRITVELMDGLI